MPLTVETLSKYVKNGFVETGTYLGDGVTAALTAGFKWVKSIELSPILSKQAREKFRGQPVTIYEGDSAVVLGDAVADVKEPVVFWLDAHFSGGNTAQGQSLTPLISELKQLEQHSIKTHTILIDDIRLVGTVGENHFPDLSVDLLIEALRRINPNYKFTFENGVLHDGTVLHDDVLVAWLCEIDYSLYENVLKDDVVKQPAYWTFKSHPTYRQILEHVNTTQGLQYMQVWHHEFPELQKGSVVPYLEWFAKNDSLGQPKREYMGSEGVYSPSNARYLYHASLILRHTVACGMSEIRIVEIGSGYGGLAYFIKQLCPFFEVTWVQYVGFDLPAATQMMSRFCKLTDTKVEISTQPEEFQPLDQPWMVVSNYAYSELSYAWQCTYLKHVVQHALHGFMVWNHGTVSLPFEVNTEDERPDTTNKKRMSFNKFVKW